MKLPKINLPRPNFHAMIEWIPGPKEIGIGILIWLLCCVVPIGAVSNGILWGKDSKPVVKAAGPVAMQDLKP